MGHFNAAEYFNTSAVARQEQAQKVETGFPQPETRNTVVSTLFPTPLLTTNLHPQFAENMKEVVQGESERQQPNNKSSRNCYQSDEDLHKRYHAVDALCRRIEQVITEHFGLGVNIKDCWLNVNMPGGFNYEHNHGGVLSGAFYLQVPEGSGDLVLHNPAVRGDHVPVIQSIHEKYMHVVPEDNDLVIFPAWITHRVEPNRSEANRISISFNAFLSEVQPL